MFLKSTELKLFFNLLINFTWRVQYSVAWHDIRAYEHKPACHSSRVFVRIKSRDWLYVLIARERERRLARTSLWINTEHGGLFASSPESNRRQPLLPRTDTYDTRLVFMGIGGFHVPEQ